MSRRAAIRPALLRLLRPRYSLRTLFVVLTLSTVFIAYHVSWIRQRHAYLKIEGVVDLSEAWGRTPDNRPRAPGLLWMFGEKGVEHLAVMENSTADYSRSKGLFPEAYRQRAVMISGSVIVR